MSTGSVYKDMALMKNGFPGESVANGSVIAVKTHEWGAGARERFDSAILIVRDPFESVLAEFNRRAAGHIGHASPDRFKRDKGHYWEEFVRSKAKDWEEMNSDWLANFKGSFLVIHYSDLVNRTKEILEKVLNFLEVSVTKDEIECAMKRKEGIYRRPKKNLAGPKISSSLGKELDDRKRRVMNLVGLLRTE